MEATVTGAMAGAAAAGGAKVGYALVPQPLQATGHPLTVGRGLGHDPRPGSRPEHGREPRGLAPDPLLDQLAPSGRIQIWLSFL